MSLAFRELCQKLSFVALGITDAKPPAYYEFYQKAVQRGLPPNLQYLVRGAEFRKDFTALLPETKSILCVALPIPAVPKNSPLLWASFCALPDYHAVMREKLGVVLEWLRENTPVQRARICVDSAPILERELASRAKLGFCARNQNLILPNFGSFVVLAELLIDYDLYAERENYEFGLCHEPVVRLCDKGCTACVAACPTKALTRAGYAPERCIAYWNTQHKGAIPADIARAMGARVWGCDTCQSVCPYNRGKRRELASFVLADLGVEDILTSSASKLRKRFKGSALDGAHPYILQRNACIVMANLGLANCEKWLKDMDLHPCDWVRAAAKDALVRLNTEN
ncbi:MAG: QueG-associated DUF1730 domain-containing protein [Bradymonadales bacterium]|jgi:epoxyqueuosine reductase